MDTTTIGVLIPVDPHAPAPPPEQRPMGRAALLLREQGILAVFGDQLRRRGAEVFLEGVAPLPGRWQPATARLDALHDRYPSQGRADRYQEALAACPEGLPVGNPPALTLLCRDKVACQRFLEGRGVPMPPLEDDPAAFADALAGWEGGAGFLKPRYGALGAGVRRVTSADGPLPAEVEGLLPGRLEPAILQRAVPPPPGWAGWSVRVLCQRLPDARWHLCPAVLRRSRADPVVNAARGAEVRPASADGALSADSLASLARTCLATCAALAGHPEGGLLAEVGLDLAIDGAGQAHLIEVNGRPRGRLEVLAALDPARFEAEHIAACGRPLAFLAAAAAEARLRR